MVRRWSEVEENALRVVRERLADQIREAPQFPEVVGDRRIIRFYCGTPKRHDLEECVSMYSKFLKWRKERGVDRIREDIVYGGKNSPLLFPHGEKIIRMAPQIVLTANATDKLEHPVALELFEFSPSEVFKQVTIDQYLEFLIYCLEYRTLVLEQISEMKERKYLQEHPNEEDREEGYGVIQRILHIRDLKGLMRVLSLSWNRRINLF